MTTTNVKPSELNYDHYTLSQYDRDIVNAIPGHKAMHTCIAEYLRTNKDLWPKPVNMLDLGVGSGITSAIARDVLGNVNLTVVDFSQTMLENAKKKLGNDDNVHYILDDYSNTDFDKQYDVILTAIGLHHQTDDGKRTLFKKIYKALTTNGVFILGDLMSEKDKEQNALATAKHFHQLVDHATDEKTLAEWAHHHLYLNVLTPREDQKQWLEDVGFTVHTVFTHLQTVLFICTKKSMGNILHDIPHVIGTGTHVPLKTGGQTPITLLNNAATTPPFKKTMKYLETFLQSYGTFHRGAGVFAARTTDAMEHALGTIRSFIGVADDQTLLFTKNTSEAVNMLARILALTPHDVVLTSDIEHTSNFLPWKYNSAATVVTIASHDDGSLSLDDYRDKIKEYGTRVKLVALTGASNLTGYVPHLPTLADTAHSVGAIFFVDAAQLAPHRPINMQRDGIDALAFSAHKVYAPFGVGVLALPKKFLYRIPTDPGGGSIDMLSNTDIFWAPSADRHQSGTWNVTGIVALAKSIEVLLEVGWQNVLTHEKELVKYAVQKFLCVPGIKLFVQPKQYTEEHRIGTFPFLLDEYHHAHLAAILEHEYGIEVRAGTICNHRLVRRWLAIDDTQQKQIEHKIKEGDRLASYGIVRASLGIHNTKEDIDRLVQALTNIHANGPKLKYVAIPEEERFVALS